MVIFIIMRKIEFTEEQTKDIIEMYNNLSSTREICSKYSVDRGVIQRILKQNNVTLRTPGRLYLGGKSEADKRYYRKPGTKEKKAETHKKWSSENREHLREYIQRWRSENIEHRREYRNNYERTRKVNDPIYKLIGNFRTAIYTVIKENDMSKYDHYFEMLGYTQEDLVSHLGSLLTDGMTWDNYGGWHVDHKLPIDSFNFKTSKDSEFKKCWSLDNLQPMWGGENLSKGTKIL